MNKKQKEEAVFFDDLVIRKYGNAKSLPVCTLKIFDFNNKKFINEFKNMDKNSRYSTLLNYIKNLVIATGGSDKDRIITKDRRLKILTHKFEINPNTTLLLNKDLKSFEFAYVPISKTKGQWQILINKIDGVDEVINPQSFFNFFTNDSKKMAEICLNPKFYIQNTVKKLTERICNYTETYINIYKNEKTKTVLANTFNLYKNQLNVIKKEERNNQIKKGKIPPAIKDEFLNFNFEKWYDDRINIAEQILKSCKLDTVDNRMNFWSGQYEPGTDNLITTIIRNDPSIISMTDYYEQKSGSSLTKTDTQRRIKNNTLKNNGSEDKSTNQNNSINVLLTDDFYAHVGPLDGEEDNIPTVGLANNPGSDSNDGKPVNSGNGNQNPGISPKALRLVGRKK